MRWLNQDQVELLEAGLYDIGLQERTVNHLEEYGVLTVGQLLEKSSQWLEAIPNVGPKTVKEVFKCLAQHGFERRSSQEPDHAAETQNGFGASPT